MIHVRLLSPPAFKGKVCSSVSNFGSIYISFCDTPDCLDLFVDLDFEFVVRACAESHIVRILGQAELYE